MSFRTNLRLKLIFLIFFNFIGQVAKDIISHNVDVIMYICMKIESLNFSESTGMNPKNRPDNRSTPV
jgi:hypothetical protein